MCQVKTHEILLFILFIREKNFFRLFLKNHRKILYNAKAMKYNVNVKHFNKLKR